MSEKKDFQLIELKDTITQLNIMIKAQTAMIESLQKSMDDLKEQLASKDQDNANLKAQVKFLSDKLYGTSSEKTSDLAGQLSLFDSPSYPEEVHDDAAPENCVQCLDVPVKKKTRKSKPSYDEMFANLKTEQVYVDTLTDDEKLCSVDRKSVV